MSSGTVADRDATLWLVFPGRVQETARISLQTGNKEASFGVDQAAWSKGATVPLIRHSRGTGTFLHEQIQTAFVVRSRTLPEKQGLMPLPVVSARLVATSEMHQYGEIAMISNRCTLTYLARQAWVDVGEKGGLY